MTCGIYQIKNKINNKIYIGQSINIEDRILHHFNALKRKDYKNENKHFINAFHKYGQDNFETSIIAICSEQQLDLFEKWFICITGSSNPKYGYNKMYGGAEAPSFKGYHHTLETKKKISDKMKGINHPNYGKTLSNATKAKISQSLKGRKLSDKHKEKIKSNMIGKNNHNFGKTFSEEYRKKISMTKNTSGYRGVTIRKRKNLKQGFEYVYQYHKNKKTIMICSVDINKLEEKVKAKNLPWEKY